MTPSVGFGRWGRWVGAGLLLAAVVIGALLVLRPGDPPTLADQARAIAAELRCPDCAGLSAADSPTQAAAEIRREVEAQLLAGQTPDEVKQAFVDRYGSWILLSPPGFAPWLVPLVVTALGGLVLVGWLLRPVTAPALEAVEDGAAVYEVGGSDRPAGSARPGARSLRARRAAGGVAAGLVVALAAGYLLPEPYSLAAETVVNQPLAEAQAAEARRQADIDRLLAIVAADPEDAAALSDLADAYLAGSTPLDLQRAAFVLIALIGFDPDDPAPYGRLITAYVRAEDWSNAAAATDALAELAPGSPDIPFFRGLIAWQGRGDAQRAIAAFDEFLAAAPDDPRVPMIRALRAEAASDAE
jgi:cytochrome c-type biogenesis protein CcmH/NrfF